MVTEYCYFRQLWTAKGASFTIGTGTTCTPYKKSLAKKAIIHVQIKELYWK